MVLINAPVRQDNDICALGYGAVNAANLDGGMSSAMWLYDEELVSSSSIRVSRQMPTAFIVLPQNTDQGAAETAPEG